MARILVIDDQDCVRQVIREFLPADHHVVEARGGAEGIRLYARQPADLVLCDLFMPGVDGIETIRELRRRGGPTKIVAISGGSFDGRLNLLRTARALGADHILHKPFGRAALLAVVEEALREAVCG